MEIPEKQRGSTTGDVLTGNIYSDIPEYIPREIFEELTSTDRIRIERIISRGHSTPEGDWYDQDNDEWVILLKGKANLLFEGESSSRELHPGDYLHIPARKKHRVESTSPAEETIWLAVHYE